MEMTMMRKLMNSRDIVAAMLIYNKTRPNSTQPVNLIPIAQNLTHHNFPKSPASNVRERKILRRSKCIIGPKLIEEILMRCIGF